tara:strand:+ start:447 stop:1301 length:855 start_codon:yes stop_codon:yes gene_type:complete
MAEFSFIEISYDPTVATTERVEGDLKKIGFIHRTQHKSGKAGFWNLQSCIVLLKQDNSKRSACITGIGFNATEQDIEHVGAIHDPETDFNVIDTGNGIKTYLLTEKQIHHFNSNLDEHYDIIDAETKSLKHLNYISGIKMNGHNVNVIEHYIKLGFKYKDISDNYGKLVCENNRFTIMLDKRTEQNNIPTIICDTHDVFDATAYFLSVGIDPETFNHNIHMNFGQKLNYKIRAYNCRAWGNEQSYTIENFIKGLAPDIDIIFRQRNQYLHIHETTLDSYYAREH